MAANVDATAQLRFMATVRRQSAPPRCNPFVIVLQVLSLGMIFIGVTMTLIAHWPGSTSIGENPLKIAGPVLLAVGVTGLIIGIILVCLMNKKERQRFQKQMAKVITSRSTDDLVGTNDASQVRGNAAAAAGVGTYPPNQAETKVRPASAAVRDAAGVSVPMTDGDTVPMPVRVTKARRHKDTSTDADLSMSSTEDLTAPAAGDAELAASGDNVARKKRRRPKPTTAEEGEALMSAAEPVQPSAGDARRLKVHIKAQPGASVRIQNAPPPVAPKPAYRSKAHETSTETDI